MITLNKLFKVNKINTNTNDTLGFYGQDANVNDPGFKFNRPRQVRVNHRSSSTVEFHDPDYDLSTISNAVQLDGILNRSVNIYVEQVLKNGVEVVSLSERLQKHYKNRKREIEFGTNIPFTETIRTITNQLVTYANAYVIKVRGKSKNASEYRLYNRTVKPIIGLFVADATTMRIGLNKSGKITHYKQIVNGIEKEYQLDDIIHLTYNKIPGTLCGRSPIISVLDDVRALRKLEEEIEILGFQYAIPLYLYTVGTDNHPAAPGEVDAVTASVNNMSTYGIIVGPHTHDIKSVTNDNDPVDVMKFVAHFKQRILAGLGISPVAMGESNTSNRNTSQVADMAMQNITKIYQSIITNKLNQEFLKELIMDGGMSPEKFELELRFPEIDMESQIKKETHILQKYQSNVITLAEARLAMDVETKIDEQDLYINNVQIPLAEAEAGIQADADIKVAKVQGKIQEKLVKIGATNNTPSGVSTKTGGRSKSSGTSIKKTQKAATNSVTAKNSPTNQHGTSTRPKYTKDYLNDSIKYIELIDSVFLSKGGHKSKLNIDMMTKKSSYNIKAAINKQVEYTIKEYKDYYHYEDDIDSKLVTKEIHEYVMIRITDKINRFSNMDNTEYNNTHKYVMNMIAEDIMCEDKINNMVKSLIVKTTNKKHILCDASDCEYHSTVKVDINDINVNSIPPFKYGCKCVIRSEDV